MNIIKAISSVQKAFSYFFGFTPRVLPSLSAKSNLSLKERSGLSFISLPGSEKIRSARQSNDKKNQLQEKKASFLQVLCPPVEGPEVKNKENITCQVLHRVAVRSIVQALHTTESRELSESEFELINTTHSSYLDSEEQRLAIS
jgi:hypothetical protein